MNLDGFVTNQWEFGPWFFWIGHQIQGGDTLLHSMIISPIVMYCTPYLIDFWDFYMMDVYPLELFVKNVVHTRVIPAAFLYRVVYHF